MYEERFYRNYLNKENFFSCRVMVNEADVVIYSSRPLDNCAQEIIQKYYNQVAEIVEKYPAFATSLSPLEIEAKYPLVKEMLAVSQLLDIGPLATVAGAIAEFSGRELLKQTPQLIVENGGDIFLAKKGPIFIQPLVVTHNSLSRVVLVLEERDYPLGICSSSSTFGHSLSLGQADLVTVVSRSAILSDGLSTRLANMVKAPCDIKKALAYGRRFEGIEGIYIVKDSQIGLWGNMKISSVSHEPL